MVVEVLHRRRKRVIIMKTLICVAHPQLDNSPTQQFLQASLPAENVRWHDLTQAAVKNWSRQQELDLLKAADRIIWQFPLYWYSAPYILKQWQDQVFSGPIAQYRHLAGKELGLVVSLGKSERHYQAGRDQAFTLSELLRPYQAFARALQWRYLAPLTISNFAYQDQQAKKSLLVRYQQYLTLAQPDSFLAQGQWLVQQLEQLKLTEASAQKNLALANQTLQDQLTTYETLQAQLQEIKAGEHTDD